MHNSWGFNNIWFESKLTLKEWFNKGKSFLRRTVDDIFFNVVPVMEKRPDYQIVHIGTHNFTNYTKTEILDKFLKPKNFVHEQHQYCQVYLLTSIIRADSAKTASVVASLQEQLLIIKIQFIYHCNITQNHLEVKQLQFKEKAVGRLALNFLLTLRIF